MSDLSNSLLTDLYHPAPLAEIDHRKIVQGLIDPVRKTNDLVYIAIAEHRFAFRDAAVSFTHYNPTNPASDGKISPDAVRLQSTFIIFTTYFVY